MRAADIIGKKLAEAGCLNAFGIPGGEVLTLMDGMRTADIDFTLVKHENAGGFMAEGSWHANGAPAILIATLGPGVANAINVIANAMQDRVPMLFITGCMDGAEAETYTHQVFDHQQLLRPIVKASFRAHEGAVGVMMDKAIALATEGQPGPVHIDLPIKVAQSESEQYAPLAAVPSRGHAAPSLIEQVKERISKAKKPLVIAGVDALNESADVASFCKRLNIPMIASYKAKGMLDERDPLSLGGAGLSPKSDKIFMPLIAESDLVLLLGYDPIEMRVGWRNAWDGKNAVEVTSTLRTHGMHSATTTLMGDVAVTVDALSEAKAGTYWENGAAEKAHADLKEMFTFDLSKEFGPEHVFATLRDAAPDETVITADSGAHRILVSQMWDCRSPRTMLQSSALCTMGCAVPLAAGYKQVKPETPVIAFVGDAGFEMMMGDLSTLRDMGTNIIICVLVDESLGLIELKQRAMQLPNRGVDFSGTDFPKVAEGFGGHGVWIDDVETLRAEFDAALKRDTFTVLCPRIGRKAYDGKF